MKSILMVCLGNICRSPLAQGILEHKLEERGIKAYVDSAGTSAYHESEHPDRRSIEVAKKYGIDISKQRSRPFDRLDFDEFDHIFVMDSSNYQNVMALAINDDQKNKVDLILNFLYKDENRAVPDPYYSELDGFEKVFDMLDKACDELINELFNE